jgi:hypothetical protein
MIAGREGGAQRKWLMARREQRRRRVVGVLTLGVVLAAGCDRSSEPRVTVPSAGANEVSTAPVTVPVDLATAGRSGGEAAGAGPAPSAASSTATATKPALVLTLSVPRPSFGSSIDASLEAVLENRGPTPAMADLCVIESPILSLEFHDAAHERVLTIPPGMPPTAEEQARCQKTLAPGEKRKISYGLHIFSPELPKGEYTARARGIESNTVSFRITGR